MTFVGFLTGFFALVQFVVCVGLVAIVASTTTKNEGLSGTLGGKASSSFHGRPGMEEQLQQYTTYLAVGFLVLSTILAYLQLGLR